MKEFHSPKKNPATGKILPYLILTDEDPNASFISFPDEQTALAGIKASSPNYKSLDGIWKFNWVKLLKSALTGSLRMITIPATGKTWRCPQTGR